MMVNLSLPAGCGDSWWGYAILTNLAVTMVLKLKRKPEMFACDLTVVITRILRMMHFDLKSW